MFKILSNEKLQEYTTVKNLIDSSAFAWFWSDRSVKPDIANTLEVPYLSHCVLAAPGLHPDKNMTRCFAYPKENSPYVDLFHKMFLNLFYINNIQINSLLRINVNLTFKINEYTHTYPHEDHPFPHKNLLIYLNNADGDTVICDKSNNIIDRSSPKEDKIVAFEGRHYHYLPTKNTRKVIVCTYI